jgi:hypothetical protein
MSFALPDCDADERLRQLAQFGTRVVPNVLRQFYAPALQECILFCLPEDYKLQVLRPRDPVSRESSFFVHEARRLNDYYKTYKQLQQHSTLYVSERCRRARDSQLGEVVYPVVYVPTLNSGGGEQTTETRRVGSYNLHFDLEALLRELYHQSRTMPLYQKVLNSSDAQQLRMLERCDRNWKHTIVKKRAQTVNSGANMADEDSDEASDAPVDLDKPAQIIPFTIVSRIAL